VSACSGNELEIIVLLNRSEPKLEGVLNKEHFTLFCTPAANLFQKRADRIHLSNRETEYHIVPDRTRPMDFEVYSIKGITGHGKSTESEQRFHPFYSLDNRDAEREKMTYFTAHREPRMLSTRQRKNGPRSSYIGSELFVSLVDANEAPYSSNLRQLGVELLCTNRDLPLQMPVGKKETDFTMELSAPVTSVRCVAGPTKPRPAHSPSSISWDLISHLSLNYLSLIDNDNEKGAEALRDLLRLYCDEHDITTHKQIDGLLSVSSKPVIRRTPIAGPMAMARGIEISLEFEEGAYEGVGIFLLGAVLEQFFARYVSINSFTQTIVNSSSRGEVMRWPVRMGRCPTI
jgi:type VI secretion system protein ImpG